MPRKILEISHEFPYHITARTNNKEWFPIPISEVWSVFNSCLYEASKKFNIKIHAFVLMNNHYHLIATASHKYPLPRVMEWLQRSVARKINYKANKINHLFGGPYEACIIKTEEYYWHALKYLYRNPIESGIVSKVQNYKFSTLRYCFFEVTNPPNGIDSLIDYNPEPFLSYLNHNNSNELKEIISWGISKKEFKLPKKMRKKIREELTTR